MVWLAVSKALAKSEKEYCALLDGEEDTAGAMCAVNQSRGLVWHAGC